MKFRNRKSYEDRFGAPIEMWDEAQMKEALIELLPPHKNRGRPASVHKLDSQKTNLRALAFWAMERKKRAAESGTKLTLKAAVEQEMLASIEARNSELDEINARPPLAAVTTGKARSIRAHHVRSKLSNAYTEVLKHKKAGI